MEKEGTRQVLVSLDDYRMRKELAPLIRQLDEPALADILVLGSSLAWKIWPPFTCPRTVLISACVVS